jgi:hypothetical protein
MKMATIKFRGKEMNLLEAKLYVTQLKKGIVKPTLTKEEKADYTDWLNVIEKTNKRCERNGTEGILKPLLNENEYLTRTLEARIGLAEHFEKMEYCEKKGHKEIKGSSHIASGSGGTRVYAHCSRCGSMYERNLTSKEWESFDEAMNTPFTI